MHTMVASVSGENIAKAQVKTNLAKRLGLNVRRISKGQRVRSHITKTNDSVWKHVQKKTRSDKINDDTKRLIYDFLMSPCISRPTGNKADIKRHRIAPKQYLSHPLYVLEKTQTDVYEEFKEQHSDIKVSQSSFERLKPFFVKPLRAKDKTTCCCRYHIEFNHAFKKCMQCQKSSGLTPEEVEAHPVYDSCEDLISDTLCKRNEEQKYHNRKCIDRLCENCGIKDDIFTAKETDTTDSADTVEWERYEYQNVKGKGTTICRKLVLVKKVTKVGELFGHFRALLEKIPRHQFNALCQNKQAKHIMEQLPEGDVVLVHDFSENYRCSTQKEIQSCSFQKTEVSLHVTIIHRHEIKDSGALDTDNIIQEQFFVISPDLKHDQHFTYYFQKLISEYLRDIKYPLKTVHEFTDGCASQYKSRHCIGSLNIASKTMGHTFIRNYYETSHAKGPQDAAGGYLKQQADLAVLRGNTIIQSAEDFFNFANKTMKAPKTSSKCKQRLFRYVEEIPRVTTKCFRPIQSVRSIHQVFASDNTTCRTRELSCYCCFCIDKDYSRCVNTNLIGADKSINLVEELNSVISDADTAPTENIPLYELVNSGDTIAVLAEDEAYYLLRAAGSVNTLTNSTTDSYQTTYEAGTRVIKGHYYCRTGNSVLSYKLETKYSAMVPALSVVYICSEINSDRRIVLSDVLHRSILSSIKN